MRITDRNDLRVGDYATFAHDGHEFSGVLWASSPNSTALFLGGAVVRFLHGEWCGLYDFVAAARTTRPETTSMGYIDFLIDFLSAIDTEPTQIMVQTPPTSKTDVVTIWLIPNVEYKHILRAWDLQLDPAGVFYINDAMNLKVLIG